MKINNVIKVRGARVHNLKNINVDIPKNKLVVFTGLSGSGKSSLAFDTIYAEGQRRYVESLSSYARQFLGVMRKPDVDSIEGLSPAISIDQKTTSHNPRSTVGTVTEIYDYIRLLFARIGHPHCPKCGKEISRQSQQQIVENTINLMMQVVNRASKKHSRFMIFSPIIRDRKGEFSSLFDNLSSKGFSQVRVDGKIFNLSKQLVLIKTNRHTIDVVIDRLSIDKKQLRNNVSRANLKSRLLQSIEQTLELSDGLAIVAEVKDSSLSFPEIPKSFQDHIFSERFSCPVCNISIVEIEPRNFSFNSPHGACPKCSGIGTILSVNKELVINQSLSILEGGILPFAKAFIHDTWFARVIKTICHKYKISLTNPLSRLTEDQHKVLIFGTGDTVHEVKGNNRQGRLTKIFEVYRGIVPELKKRHSETDSDFVRREIEKYMRREVCNECSGARLKKESLNITILDESIVDVTRRSISNSYEWFNKLPSKLSQREQNIAKLILKEITTRLAFLLSVGVEYLSLDRSARTLSGGEAQRIRLTSQIGSGLSGVIYVLDEPSIGLHPRDNDRLIKTLKKLKSMSNTILVVEHDKEIMESADYIFDFGPKAGRHGGQVIAFGSPSSLKNNKSSLTGKYLSGKKKISVLNKNQQIKGINTNNSQTLFLRGCTQHNLQNINVDFPLGKFICVTGVSGSGKSTLIIDTLYHALLKYLNPFYRNKPGSYSQIEGIEYIDKVILINQSPIGRTPRSNPATYTGAFTYIRELFSKIPEAKMRGFAPGRFSFNVKGGRCESCKGEGQTKIEMQFLADVYITCDVCKGTRFKTETLEIEYKGKNIAQILSLRVEDALNLFKNVPKLRNILQTLYDVGLSYIELGQPAPTLSGGEAQRIKLASELAKRQTGKTIYILDEPTTGLHFADLEKLLSVLHRLVAVGNTVIVIEHNIDVIKNAEYIIDLGPEGGKHGGNIIGTGSPLEISKIKRSYTGQFLKKVI